MVDQVEHCTGQRQRGGQGEAEDHVANLADDVERQDTAHLGLRRRTQHAHQHGGTGDPQQQLMRQAILRPEQGHQANQRVYADLGQQACEHRRNRRQGDVIGGRQPAEYREQRSLDGKRQQHQQQRRRHARWRLTAAHDHRQLAHVQRAAGAVDQAGGEQEDQRGEQVKGHVGHAAGQPAAAAAKRHQGEGGDQQHLEPDIEVEDVGGDEGAADAGQQTLDEQVKVATDLAVVVLGHAIEQGDQRDQGTDGDHYRRQAIDHQADAERRLPVAHLTTEHHALCGLPDQHQAYSQQQCGATQAEHAHGLQVAAQDDRQQQAAQGNEDWRNE